MTAQDVVGLGVNRIGTVHCTPAYPVDTQTSHMLIRSEIPKLTQIPAAG
jgi:hypothetical protein